MQLCECECVCLATFNFVNPHDKTSLTDIVLLLYATPFTIIRYGNVRCSSTSRSLGSRQRVPTTARTLGPPQPQLCPGPHPTHRVPFIPPLAPLQPPQLIHSLDRYPLWARRSTLFETNLCTILTHHVILRRNHQLAYLAAPISAPSYP